MPLMCGDCIQKPPDFTRLRAAFIYTEEIRRLIIAFKHFNQDGLVHVFQPWLQRVAFPLLEQADLVAPVPLHWRRLLSRGYNQSALLASSLDLYRKENPNPARLDLDLLERVRHTRPQGKLSAAERFLNLKNTIRLNEFHEEKVKGKHVLVVDDVCASSATLNVCARTLIKAGAKQVDCLVLAKTLRVPMYDTEYDVELDF